VFNLRNGETPCRRCQRSGRHRLLADVADEDGAESVEVADDELEVELDFEGLIRGVEQSLAGLEFE